MSAPSKQHAIRRSTRLPLEVPIILTSLDPALEFSEPCTTTLVNAHGCGLITQRSLPRNLPVRLEITRSGRQTTARVADVVPLGGEPETWLLGLELDDPGNVWGIEYAPSDWKIEEPALAEVADVKPEHSEEQDSATPRRWRLTDISAGACYLESPRPVPAGTPVLISVRVGQLESLLEGIVRASHPHGIGVEFTASNHKQAAAELIDRLVEQREVPRVFVGQREDVRGFKQEFAPIHEESDPDDALLELVRQGGTLSMHDFLEDLKAQRKGEHREPRVDVALSVQISGTDIHGKTFQEDIHTQNVSRLGAQLKGINAKLRSGDTVSVSYAGRTEKFRVAWVGASLTALAGQIGITTIDRPTAMWDDIIVGTEPTAFQRR